MAELAAVYAPEAGDPNHRLNRRHLEAWRESQVRDLIEAFDTTPLPDPVALDPSTPSRPPISDRLGIWS